MALKENRMGSGEGITMINFNIVKVVKHKILRWAGLVEWEKEAVLPKLYR